MGRTPVCCTVVQVAELSRDKSKKWDQLSRALIRTRLGKFSANFEISGADLSQLSSPLSLLASYSGFPEKACPVTHIRHTRRTHQLVQIIGSRRTQFLLPHNTEIVSASPLGFGRDTIRVKIGTPTGYWIIPLGPRYDPIRSLIRLENLAFLPKSYRSYRVIIFVRYDLPNCTTNHVCNSVLTISPRYG